MNESNINEIKLKIGQRVKMYRKESGLTQEKLSEIIECTPNFISNVERGSKFPSFQNLIKISDALNTPLNLFTIDIDGNSDRERISDLVSRIDKLAPRDKKITLAILETALNQQES